MKNKITGHKRQIEQLEKALGSGHIPHAYLFTGMDGIGKRLVARSFAESLLRAKLTSGHHPDLVEIEPEENEITIDRIRDLKNQTKFPPLISGRRVVIINDAHLMNPNAANAALKILEEPPANNHFILITSVPNQLLPTIISRCQSIAFSPLQDDEVKDFLVSHLKYDKEDAARASEISGGSIGCSLKITPELIDSVTRDMRHVLEDPTATNIINLSNIWQAEKGEMGNILYIIHRSFHAALKAGVSGGEVKGSSDISRLAAVILSANDTEALLDKCSLINSAHRQAIKTYNKQLMFEQLLFTLAS